jgi:hypothetical protein
MDYKNGRIYKITSDSTNKIYIGSTCQPLSKRMTTHRNTYKCFLNGKGNNITSFELIKLGDAIITLIELFPCESKEQLHARERFHIELNRDICINKCLPTRNMQEYRQDNIEKINEKKKAYREANKEKIAARDKAYKEANKEAISIKAKAKYQANKEKIAEYNKARYQANNERIREAKQ